MLEKNIDDILNLTVNQVIELFSQGKSSTEKNYKAIKTM
jgi:hypothetical protein